MRLTCPSKSAFEFQAQAHLALLDYTQKPRFIYLAINAISLYSSLIALHPIYLYRDLRLDKNKKQHKWQVNGTTYPIQQTNNH